MVMNINVSKDAFSQWVDKLNNYFSTLPPDDMIAWVAIAIGFLLFLISLFL